MKKKVEPVNSYFANPYIIAVGKLCPQNFFSSLLYNFIVIAKNKSNINLLILESTPKSIKLVIPNEERNLKCL